MVANNTIKGLTVEIGGDTTKLGKALEDINKKSGDLSKELGDINRLLKLDPSNTELLAQKQKVLTEAISNTSEKLETLKEAEKQVQAQFERGEVSEEQYRALQREVIATENKLKGYAGALKETDEAQTGAAKSTKEFGDESEKSGEKALKLGDIIKANLISDAIKAGLSALASGFKAVGEGIGTAISAGAEYADNILTLSTQTGLSTDTLEKYNAVAELTDVSLETLTKSMAKNIKSMSSGKEAYEKLGVSVRDSNGELRDSETVYWEAIDALGKIDNETERDALSMEIFGKSAQDLNTIIAMGSAGVAEYTAKAEEMGAVLGGKGLEALGALDDQFQIFKSTTAATGNILASSFAPALTTVIGGVNDIAGSFNGLIAAVLSGSEDDAQAAVENIGAQITGLVDNVVAIAPQLLDTITSLISQIFTVVQDNLPYILEQGAELLKTLLKGLSDNRDSVVSTVLNVVMTLVGVLLDNLPAILEMGLQILVSLISGIASALPELIPQIVDCVLLICETLIDNLDLLVDSGIELIMALADGLLKALPRLIDKAPVLIEKLINAITNNLPKIIEMGIQLTVQLAVGIIKAIPQLVSKLPQIIGAILTGLGDGLKSVGEIGLNLVKGLWNGIKDATSWVLGKIKGFGQSILNGIKNIFGIHSPSKEMAWVGKMLDEGLAEGVEKYADEPLDAMTDLSKGILEEAEGLDGISLDRQLQTSASNAAAAAADNGLLGKLDRILTAIEAGQILTIDGDTLVGATASKYDTALGQRRLLAARGAI